MSLFGMMNDLEDDPIFGHHMRSMRQMNNMMNSLFADPFGMFGGGGMGGMHGMGMGGHMQMNNLESIMGPPPHMMRSPHARHNAIMPFGGMGGINMNRLLNTDHMPDNGLSYSSSSVFSMSSGPDGPQVYQASSSTRTGPGGIRETRKSMQDSRSGTKQLAIGHHIGERAHIIERQQNMRTGDQEENQEYINLDDTEAEDFDREFQQKARSSLSLSGGRRLHGPEMLALPAPSSTNESTTSSIEPTIDLVDTPTVYERTTQPHQQNHNQSNHAPPRLHRRALRTPTSSLALPSASTMINSANHITTSVHPHPHPYNGVSRKNHRALKGPSSSPYNNQH